MQSQRLRTSPEVVRDAGSASDMFFLRLGQLFNTINVEDDKFDKDESTSLKMRQFRESLTSKPMPEDFQTRGIKFFSDRHKGIDWNDFTSDDDLV